MRRICLGLLISCFSFPLLINFASAAIIVDHTVVNEFDNIPSYWIEKAKQDLGISFGHTSHGSQIITGINILTGEYDMYSYSLNTCDNYHSADSLYSCCDDYESSLPTNTLSLWDFLYKHMDDANDLGSPDMTTWATATRNHLDGVGWNRKIIMWSWCGQVSYSTEDDINTYLNLMNDLENDYPNVKFVYMTGHLDGTGEQGNLNIRNQQIRDYAMANDKILFDFADIESYDPDGNYYPEGGDECGWCYTWCENHPQDCEGLPPNSEDTAPDYYGCAHSHGLNCLRKGKAFWWLMARLAGWNGGQTQCTDTCKDEACSTYDDCASASGTCTSGYCCSGTCTTPSQTCTDGTAYGQCSSNKPKYCDNGNLVNRCSQCGCPGGYNCQADDSCQPSGNVTGPVAWYRFDEGSGAVAADSSGNGNDGTIYGATWTNGIKGKALDFDGNGNYVDFGADPSIQSMDDNFSVEIWFKAKECPATINSYIFSRYAAYGFRICRQGTPNFGYITFNKTTDADITYNSGLDLTTNTWYHAALIFKNHVANFYLNGSLLNNQSCQELENTGTTLAGAWSDSYGWFNGTIDEARIYDRSLSTEEIMQHYNEGIGTLPGLSWEAEAGVIIPPFSVTSGYIYQAEGTDLLSGGKATYRFNINTPGNYIIKTTVDAPDTGSNSFFVNIDSEPTDPYMIWDIDFTNGFENRNVTWRGNGTYDNNEFVPKIFALAAGEHELVIRGREANTLLDKITLQPCLSGDINGDGSVNIADLGIIASNFGKTSGFNPKADVTQNGKIDIFDIVFVASRFT